MRKTSKSKNDNVDNHNRLLWIAAVVVVAVLILATAFWSTVHAHVANAFEGVARRVRKIARGTDPDAEETRSFVGTITKSGYANEERMIDCIASGNCPTQVCASVDEVLVAPKVVRVANDVAACEKSETCDDEKCVLRRQSCSLRGSCKDVGVCKQGDTSCYCLQRCNDGTKQYYNCGKCVSDRTTKTCDCGPRQLRYMPCVAEMRDR